MNIFIASFVLLANLFALPVIGKISFPEQDSLKVNPAQADNISSPANETLAPFDTKEQVALILAVSTFGFTLFTTYRLMSALNNPLQPFRIGIIKKSAMLFDLKYLTVFKIPRAQNIIVSTLAKIYTAHTHNPSSLHQYAMLAGIHNKDI